MQPIFVLEKKIYGMRRYQVGRQFRLSNFYSTFLIYQPVEV